MPWSTIVTFSISSAPAQHYNRLLGRQGGGGRWLLVASCLTSRLASILSGKVKVEHKLAQENVYLLRAVWLTINQQRTIILILSVFQTKRKDHLYWLGWLAGCYIPFHLLIFCPDPGWCLPVMLSVWSITSVMSTTAPGPRHSRLRHSTHFTQDPSFAPKPGLVSVFTLEVSGLFWLPML